MSELQDVQERLHRIQVGLRQFAERYLRKASARIAGRAVGAYMRNSTTRGRRFPWDKGPLRIVSGRLARSLSSRGHVADTGGQPEGIMTVEVVAQAIVRLIKGSKVPYAVLHEESYSGPARVKAHTREVNRAFTKRVQGPRDVVRVRAHNRYVRIPPRPFLGPALRDELPLLREMAEEELGAFVASTLSGGAAHG